MRALILVHALFAISALQAQVHEAPLSLPGLVSDSKTHVALVGARVSIVGDLAAHDVFTDSKGSFVLPLSATVRPGQIVRLIVDMNGYDPYTENVTVGGPLPQAIFLVAKSSKSQSLPARVSVKGDSAPAPRPAVSGPRLWAMTNDYVIDEVEKTLNALPSKVADSDLVGVLRPLFNQPVFIDIREELPETGLYRFCRSKQILVFYANRFSDPQVRGEALYSAQKLIYVQDELGKSMARRFRRKLIATDMLITKKTSFRRCLNGYCRGAMLSNR
jgi:hypothetical protein